MSSSDREPSFTVKFMSGVLIVTLLLPAISKAVDKPKGLAISTPKGQTLYTKFSLFYEDLCHRTTNYRKGVLVPVNTEVTFVKASKKYIIVALPDGKNLKIENVEEYSGENIDGIFTRTFSTNKMELSQFTDAERKGIAQGEVKPGMKKAAVVVAIGYPPKHRTPTLESDQWRYWRNRFKTFVVQFENDVVTKIQN